MSQVRERPLLVQVTTIVTTRPRLRFLDQGNDSEDKMALVNLQCTICIY